METKIYLEMCFGLFFALLKIEMVIDRIFDIAASLFRCGINSLERGCVFRWIVGGREDRTGAEEVIDPLNPKVIVGVHIPLPCAGQLAEQPLFEVGDHCVASRNAGCS